MKYDGFIFFKLIQTLTCRKLKELTISNNFKPAKVNQMSFRLGVDVFIL